MFTFEDVGKIDDRSVQTILKEVPRDQLVIALKTASDDLKDLLFRNISQRAAEMLKDDLGSWSESSSKTSRRLSRVLLMLFDDSRLKARFRLPAARLTTFSFNCFLYLRNLHGRANGATVTAVSGSSKVISGSAVDEHSFISQKQSPSTPYVATNWEVVGEWGERC